MLLKGIPILSDLGSTHGTFVEGKRLEKDEHKILVENAIIRLAGVDLTLVEIPMILSQSSLDVGAKREFSELCSCMGISYEKDLSHKTTHLIIKKVGNFH